MAQTPMPAEAPKPKSKNMLLAIIIIVILVVVGVGVYILLPKSSTPTGVPVKIFDNGCTDATNCGFNPANMTIYLSTNATVTWTNTGTLPHTVTSDTTLNGGLPSFNSGSSGLSTNQQYTYTFTQAGTYHYYCAIHPFMKAVVIVKP